MSDTLSPKSKKVGKFEVAVLRPGDDFTEWDAFVDVSPQGCIFCRSWWLEAVCGDEMEILVLRKGGKIVAGMPMARYRKWGLGVVHMPQLTQTLGILLAPPTSSRYEKQLSAEMEVLGALVEAIPPTAYFNAYCHHSITNWLPFHWAGYEQTTRYTYVLDDLSDLDAVFAGFSHSKRKNIKKAESTVTVREDMPPRDFYAHHERTLREQGDTIFYSYELFERVHTATRERDAGRTWYAADGDGNVHAAIFVVHDPASAYYLISTIDPAFRNSGAATLLVRDAVAYAAERSRAFDFEGSMIQGVEGSFRKFGAVQKRYFHLRRNHLPLVVRAALALCTETAAWLRARRRR